MLFIISKYLLYGNNIIFLSVYNEYVYKFCLNIVYQ